MLTSRLPRAWAAAARHPQVVDALLGTLIGVVTLLDVLKGPRDNPGRGITVLDVLTAVVAVLLVTARRRWPVPVLVVATIGAAWSTAVGGTMHALTVAALICAYTVASRTNRTTAWTAGGAAALVIYLAGAFSGPGWDAPESLGDLAWMGMAVAIGDAVRTRRAYIAAVEERAVRAEQNREEEARRLVVEERLRIARELHDVVAHNIALINVQAGVAAHVLRQQPDRAEEALGHIRLASRTVLDELSAVLNVLRSADEPETSTEPAPGLSRLSGLLGSVAAAGLRVEHRQDGEARTLPSAVDLAAYRIVQESLTNAQKHGGDPTAHLRLSYLPDGLVIAVENRVAPGAPPSGATSGHGLTGMRERAASVGGTLDAGSDANDRFAVHVFLPAPVSQEVSR
jgi:signal transduction histidine kinase